MLNYTLLFESLFGITDAAYFMSGSFKLDISFLLNSSISENVPSNLRGFGVVSVFTSSSVPVASFPSSGGRPWTEDGGSDSFRNVTFMSTSTYFSDSRSSSSRSFLRGGRSESGRAKSPGVAGAREAAAGT